MTPLFRLNLTPEGVFHYKGDKSQEKTTIVRYKDGDRLTIILQGRLYYLSDLKKTCHLSGEDPLSLIAELYQTQGEQGLSQLEGEFALVIGDRQEKRLILCRDPLGNYPLYWRENAQGITVSSRLKALGDSPTSQINERYLAHYLSYSFAFTELPQTDTIYAHCYRLLPGQVLTLAPGERPQTICHNSLLANLTPITDITPLEAGQQFRTLLNQGIQERCQFGNIGAHLSGGMDSSAVVCLAAKKQPLTTLSLVYHLKTLAQETDYIQLILDQYPDLNAVLINGDRLLDFRWFDQPLPEHDEPYVGLFHLAIETVLAEKAAELGLNTVLTGSGAEIVAETNHYGLADQLRQGQWQAVLQKSQQWAIASNQNLWTILTEFAVKPLLPAWLRLSPRTVFHQGVGRWPQLGSYDVAPWIRPQFRRDQRLGAINRRLMRQLSMPPIERSLDQLALNCLAGVWANWYLNNPRGIHIAQPFLDPRVIQFCLALPAAIRDQPGLKKPLMSLGFNDLLPPAILHRKYKANFNEPYWKGLNQNLEGLKQLVRRSPLGQADSSPSIFDAAVLSHCLENHAGGIGDIDSGSHLCRALALMAWANTNA
ncbi:MAG: asparagine synthase-related protein [Synechocystis sp.]